MLTAPILCASINIAMKKTISFTLPATNYGRIRSGVRPGKVIVDRKTRERYTRKVKHKRDWSEDE